MRRDEKGLRRPVPGRPGQVAGGLAAYRRRASRLCLSRLHRHGSALRATRRRVALAAGLGRRGPLRGRARLGPALLRDRRAAAERDGRAAHGSRAECVDPGPPHPVAPHAGLLTLWQPGYDHAGIATQNVVERALAKEGLTRHDLGREAFVARTWEWLEHYGGVIYGQFRRLGASLDYWRERFTMDEGYVRAVLKFFVHLYDRGLLYRDNRIVNWCPRCASAISDLEVNHTEVDDQLFTIRYPLADDTGYGSRSRPSGLRPCSPTSPSPSIRTTTATGISWGERRSSRRGPACPDHRGRTCRSASSERAPSRSRPVTTRWTSKSAATHGLPELDRHRSRRLDERDGWRARWPVADRGREADCRDPP